MIKAFKIGNFKAFVDTQNISIQPLTLIYGANSSGKSSIIHSLLLAKHTLDESEFDFTVLLSVVKLSIFVVSIVCTLMYVVITF